MGSRLAAQVREQLEEWRRIGAGPQLLHWIAKGVAITFTNGPPPSYDLGASLTSMTEEENSFIHWLYWPPLKPLPAKNIECLEKSHT